MGFSRKKRGSGSRDLGLDGHSNGKGDANRVSDVQTYRANFESIDWGRKPIHPGPLKYSLTAVGPEIPAGWRRMVYGDTIKGPVFREDFLGHRWLEANLVTGTRFLFPAEGVFYIEPV